MMAVISVPVFASGAEKNHGYISSKDISEKTRPAAPGQEAAPVYKPEDTRNLTVIQKQARAYREEGLSLQRLGKLDEAMSLFQKAIELDPGYAVAYNDLGVIYEAKGMSGRAEQSYLKAIEIDPDYLSPYSNLAIFYENARDLEKAATYWKKRAESGSIYDPWTIKARNRLEDIRLVLGEEPIQPNPEEKLVNFIKDVSTKKEIIKEELYSPNCRPDRPSANEEPSIKKAKEHFWRAKLNYKKGDYITALREAENALTLDPSNEVIVKFIEELQNKVLSN